MLTEVFLSKKRMYVNTQQCDSFEEGTEIRERWSEN